MTEPTWTDTLGGQRPPGARPVVSSPRVADRWAQAALAAEIERVRAASNGTRNNALNVAAFNLGQIVAGGALEAELVAGALADAARAAGLAHGEIGPTIASGMSSGAQSPRTAPERPRHAERAGPAPAAVDDSAPLTIAGVLASWTQQGPLVHEPTGIATLDDLTGGGPVYGSRWYLAGAPDAGKTALLVQLADELAGRGVMVGLLAADEDPDDLVTRLAQRAGWSRHHCEARDRGVLQEMTAELGSRPLRLYPSEWTIDAAAADLARRARDAGTRAFMGIDSVQTCTCATELARVAAGGRELGMAEAVTERVRAIRRAATEHRMIVVATSELGRSAYRSRDSADQTADLASAKWSGAIEYSARVLLVLRSVADEPDLVAIAVAKNKHGPSGDTVHLRLDRRCQSLVQTGYEVPPEDTRDTHARDETRRDAAHVAAVLAAQPGIGVRQARAAAKARAGCGSTRADAGMAYLGAAVLRVPGTRGAVCLYLDGEHVPADVLAGLEADDRATVEAARHPAPEGDCA